MSSAVAPRMGRVSRNAVSDNVSDQFFVAPRMGRVSRNQASPENCQRKRCRAPHGACE